MKYFYPSWLLLALLTLATAACSPMPYAKTALSFAHLTDPHEEYQFQRSAPTDEYLTQLRTTYKLDQVVAGKKTDLERVQAVCAWVHTRWAHDGQNEPRQHDPIAILQEAAQGKRFRCVEYGIVLSGALNAVGLPARVVDLKTMDVETRASGAGHVLTEAWLPDQHKWVLVDGQWDVIPLRKGVPLNAVELQQALAEQAQEVTVLSASGTSAATYEAWIRPYLFFFDTGLDSRFGIKHTAGSLMLVPLGARNPTVFQATQPIANMQFTHSVASFYPPL